MAKSLTTIALLAAFAVIGTTAAALAQPGVATSGVNVRSGPGTNYSKLGSFSAGEVVDVEECQSSWCYVDRQSGKDGWVAANYLEPVGIQDDAEPEREDIPFNFGVTVGPNGPSFSFGVGNQPQPPQPQPVGNKACFHSGTHYSGQSICVDINHNSSFLMPPWDNNIESIALTGIGYVEICREPNFGGGCIVHSSSKTVLHPSYANNVSSWNTHY